MVKRAENLGLIVIASTDPDLGTKWGHALLKQFAVHVVMNWKALEKSVSTLKPAALVLDRSLLPGSGRLSGPMRRLTTSTKTIIISSNINEKEGVGLLKAGAKGYCTYNPGPQTINKVVNTVLRGEIWAGRKVIQLLLDELAGLTEHLQRKFLASPDERLRQLTPREREIVSLIGRGASNKEIANSLNLSENTVKSHLTGVFRKLKLSDRLQLALFVAQFPRIGVSSTPLD